MAHGDEDRTAHVEWVGGQVEVPFDEIGRPALAVWIDSATMKPLATEVSEPGILVPLLLDLIEEHGAPDSIRVADVKTAASLQDAVRARIPITVGPTMEMEAFREALRHLGPDHFRPPPGPTTLGIDGMTEDLAASLHEQALTFWEQSPWSIATDTQLMRLDAPALGVKGRGLAICGSADEEGAPPGLLVMSAPDAKTMARAMRDEEVQPADGSISFGFLPNSAVPLSMQREAELYGWPLPEADVFPVVSTWLDGEPGPPAAHDVRIVTATAFAAARFVPSHAGWFRRGGNTPVAEEYEAPGGDVVTLAMPFISAMLRN